MNELFEDTKVLTPHTKKLVQNAMKIYGVSPTYPKKRILIIEVE